MDKGQGACPEQNPCPVSPHQLSDSRRQLILVPQGASALGTPVGALPQQSPQSFLGIVCSGTHGEEFSFCSDCNTVRLWVWSFYGHIVRRGRRHQPQTEVDRGPSATLGPQILLPSLHLTSAHGTWSHQPVHPLFASPASIEFALLMARDPDESLDNHLSEKLSTALFRVVATDYMWLLVT